MSDLEPIGKYLAGLTIRTEDGRDIPVVVGDAPSPAMLLDPRITPPRTVLDAQMANLESILAREWLADREFYVRERARVAKLLAWNDLRDEMQAGRPAGCWCLGRGWRTLLPHEATVEYEGEVRLEEAVYPVIASGRSVKYCECEAGAAIKAEHERAREAETQRVKDARLEALWGPSGLPPGLRDRSGRTWIEEIRRRDAGAVPEARGVLDHLSAWSKTGDWLWLDGPYGRGKTVLLQLLCAAQVRAGRTVLFLGTAQLLDELRLSYSELGERTAALIRSLTDVDVLALDDVGKEKPSPWVRERFYVLVNARYVAGKRTLFTSNLDIRSAALSESLDESVVQRIGQMCGETGLVTLAGPNLRAAPHH